MFLFNRPNYPKITISEYRDQYENEPHVLIDVRTRQEFSQGHLPNAMNIPMDEVNTRMDEIPNDITVILVCATGNRSGMVASALTKAGYTNVYNLEGGTMSWLRLGLPINR
ncbi:MAG: hypothetical protein Kow00117_20030 [Phototrophicales bacterium]